MRNYVGKAISILLTIMFATVVSVLAYEFTEIRLFYYIASALLVILSFIVGIGFTAMMVSIIYLTWRSK